MKGVDKLIFNIIAAHGNVNLPEVGAIGFERSAAKLRNKHELAAPVNRAVYYREPIQDAPSIIDMIAEQAQCDEVEARRIYKRWLYGAKVDDRIVIAGVGEIRSHFFYPVANLQAQLNPLPIKIRIKPRSRLGAITWILFAILLIGGASVSGYYYPEISEFKFIVESKPAQKPVVEVVAVIEQPVAVDTVAVEPKPDYAAMKYQIVAGVYKSEQNADKFIANERLDSIGYTKVVLANGNIIISLYSTDNATEAETQRQQLSARFPQAWIYEQK